MLILFNRGVKERDCLILINTVSEHALIHTFHWQIINKKGGDIWKSTLHVYTQSFSVEVSSLYGKYMRKIRPG